MARTRVRWGRICVVAVSACVALGVIGNGAGAGAAPPGPHRSVVRTTARVYVVEPGDTLWRIAVGQVGRREDPRPFVDRLVTMNHLSQAVIVPGQRLVLPD